MRQKQVKNNSKKLPVNKLRTGRKLAQAGKKQVKNNLKIKKMYNRKFDIHKDFSKLNELENTIMPIIRKMEEGDEKETLQSYVRKIFNNQWKQ